MARFVIRKMGDMQLEQREEDDNIDRECVCVRERERERKRESWRKK